MAMTPKGNAKAKDVVNGNKVDASVEDFNTKGARKVATEPGAR